MKWNFSFLQKKSKQPFFTLNNLKKVSFFSYQEWWIAGVFVLSLALAILPILYFKKESEKIAHLDYQLKVLEKQSHYFFAKERERALFKSAYLYADPAFLTNYVESIELLKEEKRVLKEIKTEGGFEGYRPIEERLMFLASGKNTMHFEEVACGQSDVYEEKSYKLSHPVEVEKNDVEKVLSFIEGVKVGPFVPPAKHPQLFFTSFVLEKHPLRKKSDVYQLDIEVVQRLCHE